MNPQKILILTKFLNNFTRENRLILKETTEISPAQEAEKIETKIEKYEKFAEKRRERSETTLSTINPVEVAIKKLNEENDQDKNKIFEDLLDGKVDDNQINLEQLTPENIESLIDFALQKSTKKEESIGKFMEKIEKGPLDAYHLNKNTVKNLLSFFLKNGSNQDFQAGVKIKTLVNTLSKSPTRMSEFIELSQEKSLCKDEHFQQELLNYVDKDILKTLLKTYGEKFSTKSLCTLINLEIIKMTEDQAIIKALPIGKKVDIFIDEKGQLKNENGKKIQKFIWKQILKKDCAEMIQRGDNSTIIKILSPTNRLSNMGNDGKNLIIVKNGSE
ncbi:MAG: hypothetical protein PHP74_00445, partial [Candidatus Gracilibacteria bacterium]|nr:hypothetical protein [Candidatus Gracilibacteria bacterium]